MSANCLKIIPTDPWYVPDSDTREKAEAIFSSVFSPNTEISSQIFDTVTFIDAGVNFGKLTCPSCMQEVSASWWQNMMDRFYNKRYIDIIVDMPCCGANISLNDIIYEWPIGFSRFVMQAVNPKISSIESEKIYLIEQVLKCAVRVIWAHY